ncbi:MAG: hypothetical protein K8S99_09805 [Planctomycetes bacterium]|nr:hypothetical protein [Planctomycetota bacterium]
MRRKILVITFFTTMAFWLGCAGPGPGEDSNYKELEEDNPKFQTEPNRPGSMKPPEAATDAQAAAPAPATQTYEAVPITTGLADTMPAPDSLDRSYWERITIAPYSGKTTHPPSYYKEYGLSAKHEKEPTLDDQTEAELNATLDGARAGGWNATNSANLFIDSLGWGFDTVALPVRAVMAPPWTKTTTPR